MDLPDYWRHPLPDMCPRSCLIWARLQRTEQGGGAEERGGGQGVRPDGGVEVEESDLTSILGRCHAKRATCTPIRHTVPGRMELFCLPHGAAREEGFVQRVVVVDEVQQHLRRRGAPRCHVACMQGIVDQHLPRMGRLIEGEQPEQQAEAELVAQRVLELHERQVHLEHSIA